MKKKQNDVCLIFPFSKGIKKNIVFCFFIQIDYLTNSSLFFLYVFPYTE